MARKSISKDGASIKFRAEDPSVKPYQYFPLSLIKGITGRYEIGYGAKLSYAYTDLIELTIDFVDQTYPALTFDIQDITNQAGWTANQAGLDAATADINSWITSATGGGSSTPGSVTLDNNDALGGDGTEYIFGTGVVTGKNYKYLVANEDTTFTTLAGSTTADLRTDLGITTNTVGKGLIIRGLNGETITDVTLATGSVVGIL